MKAIIMAGGEGTRLRPLTCSMPKPMTKVANKPILQHILTLLKNNGITEAAATLLYLPQIIKDYFGNGENFGVNLTYFEETKPLGTAGGVKNCSSFIDDTFIVISGDAACDYDLKAAIAFHKEKKSMATLILTKVEEPLEYGVVLTANDGKIERFIEKPSWSRAYSDTVNTGIYIFEKSCLELIPENTPFDFGKDLFPLMLRENMPLYGYIATGYWCDIGSEDAYLQCNMDALEGKYLCEKTLATTTNKAIIIPPCIIGENVVLGSGAIIGPYTILGNNVVVQDGVTIKKSIVYDGCFLGNMSEIRGAVLANDCIIKESSRIFEGAILGEKCIVGKNSQIDKGVKLWPCKTIGENLRATTNVIWGEVKEGLFDDDGIKGDTGLDITPELVAKIGASICFTTKNKMMLIANGGGKGAEMFSLSLAAGILSAGGEVFDVGECSENIWRFAAWKYGAGSGIYINEGQGKTSIKLCGEKGSLLKRTQERKIESAFFKEDSNRQTTISKATENISSIKSLYKAYLKELCPSDLKGLSVLVNCPNTDLLSSLKETITVSGGKINAQGISFFISPDGMSLSLSDEKGNYYSGESTKALLAQAYFASGEKELVVQYDAPVALEKIADAFSAKIIRIITDEDEFSLKSVNKIFIDGCIGAMYILKALEQTNQTLNKFASSLIPFYTVVTSVEALCGKGLIMRKLSEFECSNKEHNEGIRLNLDNGNVLITPLRKGKQFIIRTEANKAELAKELSISFEELIKNIKEGD